MASSDLKNCFFCNKSGARSCSKCHSISYCSPKCQRRDWRTHKLLCASFASFDNSSRPTDEHVRAIFFPVNDSIPQLVWLHCRWCENEGTRCQSVDTSPFMGLDTNKQQDSKTDEISYNHVVDKKLPNLIFVNFCDISCDVELEANKSVANTCALDGNIYFWQGPVIAYGIVGLGGTKEITYRDLDMVDFRHIVDYLRESHNYRIPRTIKPSIIGVRINCVGDRNQLNRPFLELVEVPPNDNIFAEPNTDSDIASCIGLPILTRRYPPHPSWSSDRGNYVNLFATILNLSCYDPGLGTGRCHKEEIGWGWAPDTWQNYVGSILVVRQDRKPLSLWHAEALCSFCQDELQPRFESALEKQSVASRRAVMAMINATGFLRFWNGNFLCGYPSKNRLGRNIYIPNPYEV
ncbi:hypothetical protein QAD02_016269 [Eretmocerus hayati]|uniref:Uncharacterized protein n=1 Tax=Eretmocerus hayati TaxID=131215 RepID=A0ACC2PAZ1_9HYME|nr:hypothetical protein QAD02_016269 [Eretmocerus hayati]